MPELQVRTMTPTEFDEWRSLLARAYADEQVSSGNWDPDGAVDRAMADNAGLLPQGLATEGMLLLKALGPGATAVGHLWIGLEHPRGTADCAFLYDIEVGEPYRGQGYGRALLAAAEDAVRSHGVSALELNVFGGHTTAIALYRGAGYVLVQQQMRKGLE